MNCRMAQSKKSIDVDDLQDTFLECPVCVEYFDQRHRRPRVLSTCLHAFCTPCLDNLLQRDGRGQVTCPVCRRVETVRGKADSLRVDPVRSNLIDFLQMKQKKVILCTECNTNPASAVSQCKECKSFLCEQCQFVHKNHRVSRGHTILSLKDVMMQSMTTLSKSHFCETHPQHQIEFFCATDEKLCCVSCTVLDHRGHDLQKLKESAGAKKQELEADALKLQRVKQDLKAAKIQDEKRKKTITDTKSKSLRDIESMFSKIQKQMNERKSQLIADVVDKSNKMSTLVEKNAEANDQTLATLESTETYFTQAEEKADDVDMLQMYPSIKRSMTSLGPPQPVPGFDASVQDFRFQKKMENDVASLIAQLGHLGMASTSTNPDLAVSMEERYRAAMVLAGAGDALGYKNGEWECHSGSFILDELEKLGGLANIKVIKRGWPVSDETVMHIATAEALIDRSANLDREKMFKEIARTYKRCMGDMSGRAPGATCMKMTHKLNPEVNGGYKIPFNPRGGGCGPSMWAMCIGLRFPRPEELNELVAVSVESGRMTHHHPTGYLGALASALFTAYAIQGKNPVEWASGLLEVVDKEARQYIIESDNCTEDNLNEFAYFVSAWEDYIKLRNLKSGKVEFPEDYADPRVRDKFYKKISFGGWGGASGHDSTIIAYDAVLGAERNWEELCKRGMFHGGDSDSTGTIAACWFGAMYGFTGVPPNNYEKLEYIERIKGIAKELFELADPYQLGSGQVGSQTSKGSDVDMEGQKPTSSSSEEANSPKAPQGKQKEQEDDRQLPDSEEERNTALHSQQENNVNVAAADNEEDDKRENKSDPADENSNPRLERQGQAMDTSRNSDPSNPNTENEEKEKGLSMETTV